MTVTYKIAATFAAATALVAVTAGCSSDADTDAAPTTPPADAANASPLPAEPIEIVKPAVLEGQPDWCFDTYTVFLDPSTEVSETANRLAVIADGPAAGTAIQQPLNDLVQFVQDYPQGPTTEAENDKLLDADAAVQSAFSELCGGKTMTEAFNETIGADPTAETVVPAPE